MSVYLVAQHPADNASLRLYDKPPVTIAGTVKNNGVSTSAFWLMVESPENRARYNALFSSENPPTTHAEALERAGATLYTHWHQCELIRNFRSPTIATNIVFKKVDKTEENLRLAEKELDENTLGLEEGQIVEERKTLRWLKEQ